VFLTLQHAAPCAALQENIASVCAMSRKYDMPRLMDSAESWLVHAARAGALLVPLPNNGDPPSSKMAASSVDFVAMLSLAREFKLPRFAAECDAAVNKLGAVQARQVLNLQTAEALKP